MTKQNEKKRMMQFIINRIEEANKSKIITAEPDHIVIAKKEITNNQKLYIFLHNKKTTERDYRNSLTRLTQEHYLISNIFYKDGKIGMVRLGQRANLKGDDRSLKRYNKNERDKMIHLRQLEKIVLNIQQNEKIALNIQQKANFLAYYQPETERLQESIRIYQMQPVHLDYSHIQPGDDGYGFVQNRESTDYKIAEELLSITSGGILFRPISKGSKFRIPVPQERKSQKTTKKEQRNLF